MKREHDPIEDRRRTPRKKIVINVQLKVGIHLKGIGYTSDISEHGILVKTPEIFSFFRPELAHVFEDADLDIYFPNEDVAIQGKVTRIDAVKEELAIRIIGKSSELKWKEICG